MHAPLYDLSSDFFLIQAGVVHPVELFRRDMIQPTWYRSSHHQSNTGACTHHGSDDCGSWQCHHPQKCSNHHTKGQKSNAACGPKAVAEQFENDVEQIDAQTWQLNAKKHQGCKPQGMQCGCAPNVPCVFLGVVRLQRHPQYFR